MQYLLLIHNNTSTPISDEQWAAFFTQAQASGFFKGGSEIKHTLQAGSPLAFDHYTFSGFMRFDTDSRADIEKLLEDHPVVVNGGTVDLFEMPKS